MELNENGNSLMTWDLITNKKLHYVSLTFFFLFKKNKVNKCLRLWNACEYAKSILFMFNLIRVTKQVPVLHSL